LTDYDISYDIMTWSNELTEKKKTQGLIEKL